MFSGSITALVTPFENGKIDEKSLCNLIEFQIKNGTSGIVFCGTTGESATLSKEEFKRVIKIGIKQVNKRIKVIVGSGSNSTQEAIKLTKDAFMAGADASLQVCPYYNKPTQRGLYLHFKVIAKSTQLPIILYNVPSRTVVNIEPETVAKLAHNCPNIIAIKEASGNLEQMKKIKKLCPDNFELFSGDDSMTLEILNIGGDGVISVISNILPKEVARLIAEYKKGNVKQAIKIDKELAPLAKSLFIESNPIPVKTALGLMKMCRPDLRLPLCEMAPENLEKLKKVLGEYNLIK